MEEEDEPSDGGALDCWDGGGRIADDDGTGVGAGAGVEPGAAGDGREASWGGIEEDGGSGMGPRR